MDVLTCMKQERHYSTRLFLHKEIDGALESVADALKIREKKNKIRVNSRCKPDFAAL